jgi:hypothetical protein
MFGDIRENSLFDTPLKYGSLFDTIKVFLPYLTLALFFFALYDTLVHFEH